MRAAACFENIKPSPFHPSPKRGCYYDITDAALTAGFRLPQEDLSFYESLDTAYRALCAMLYNYAPLSGHPGGSISSGRIAQAIIFDSLDYDFSSPAREDADMISYAAGHKALGLYALWALRNELLRQSAPALLPSEKDQLRFEDLLGFRKNSETATPLFKKFGSKPLDGHPTPATPFVKIATGASGFGFGASAGLALAAADIYPSDAPKVHVIEGEGGMTAGRVQEVMAMAATAQLSNIILHVDWNQSSIDSDNVCPENGRPGDYVQWTPAELLLAHDWNVINVPNGHDFYQIIAAQRLALSLKTNQPTAIVYRTVKGWRYGIQGRSSHGAGHKFSSDGFYTALEEFKKYFGAEIPRFSGDSTPEVIEDCFWNSLQTVRGALAAKPETAQNAAAKTREALLRLNGRKRAQRADAPDIKKLSSLAPETVPANIQLSAGQITTLRRQLADTLACCNRTTQGALLVTTADLGASTSAEEIAKDFPAGFYNKCANSKSRLVASGGICEDAMGSIMTGVSAFGRHIGVTASYSAFIAALEHVSSRLHAIGRQADTHAVFNTFIMINAHSGLKTGEDGPTHADPQALQLLQENFPAGSAITLTPWEPQEIWPLVLFALHKRPALLAPFVTRPPETVIDRAALGLAPAAEAVNGLYALRRAGAEAKRDGTIVLQGCGVTTIFVREVLPEIIKRGFNVNVFYVSSAELFAALPKQERDAIYPAELAAEAMGITDFTLPTMHSWVKTQEGISRTLHPFMRGRFLGSGSADKVYKEAALHAEGQLAAVSDYVLARRSGGWC